MFGSSLVRPHDRRIFLRDGSLLLLAAERLTTSAATAACAAEQAEERAAEQGSDATDDVRLRVGLVTDLHHADKPTAGARHYRDTLAKLDEATRHFQTAKVDLVVELGDFIDAAASVDVELGYLRQVAQAFGKFQGPRHHVLGNHCVDMLTKDEFLTAVGQRASYYSFDAGGVHFVVLDSCFRADGRPYGRKNATWTDANVPPEELDWLRADLKAAAAPVVVLAHQRLDNAKQYSVKNARQVRAVLEDSHKVRAVFQGRLLK